MHIVNITDKDRLNGFVALRPHSRFLQSWEWGEFQELAGSKISRIGVEDEGRLVAAATLIRRELGIGRSYFFCPQGPELNFEFRISNFESNPDYSSNALIGLSELLFDEILSLAKKDKAIFIRIEPSFKIQNSKLKIVRTTDIQPSKTIILDLSKSEDRLLKDMHQKTRYNIGLAEKKGVKVRKGLIEDFEKFWDIMCETKERDKFRLHTKNYYLRMLNYDDGVEISDVSKSQIQNLKFQINPKSQIPNLKLSIKLYIAEYEGKVIAGNIMAFYGDTVTYMHGASSNEYRNVMAPFSMQGHCIKLAKSLGYKYYDFFGIDESKWPGVTRFKRGFGGEEIQYPGTFDIVLHGMWYNIYKLVRAVRRMY